MSRQCQSLPAPTVGESMLTHFSWQPIKTSDESKRQQFSTPFLDLKNQQRAGKNVHSRFPRYSMKCYGYQRRPRGTLTSARRCQNHLHVTFTLYTFILGRFCGGTHITHCARAMSKRVSFPILTFHFWSISQSQQVMSVIKLQHGEKRLRRQSFASD